MMARTEAHRRKEEGESRVREFKLVLDRLRALMSAGKLKVRVVDGRVVVVLPSDVLFSPGSASLGPEGTTAVTNVAAALAGLPGRRFQVEGDTDSTPIRSRQFPSNWELASARALNVLRAMLSAGMPPARVSAASYGATRPVSPNATAEGRALNRRIDITLVPDLSTLPGMEELKRAAPGGAQETLANEEEEPETAPAEEPAPSRKRSAPRAGKRAEPAEEPDTAGGQDE